MENPPAQKKSAQNGRKFVENVDGNRSRLVFKARPQAFASQVAFLNDASIGRYLLLTDRMALIDTTVLACI